MKNLYGSSCLSMKHLNILKTICIFILSICLCATVPACSSNKSGDDSSEQTAGQEQQMSSKDIKKQVKALDGKSLTEALETLSQLDCEWEIIDDKDDTDITSECVMWTQDEQDVYTVTKVKKKWLADKYTLTVKYNESAAAAKQAQAEKEAEEARAKEEEEKAAEEARQKAEQEKAAAEAKAAEEAAAAQRQQESSAGRSSSSSNERTVYVTSSGKKYHLSGCRTIKSSNTTSMTIAEAKSQGYTACGVCNPG